MTRGIAKVYAAPAVVVVDLLRAARCRVCPVRPATGLDAREDLVKLRFADQESVVRERNVSLGRVEVEAHSVGRVHYPEGMEPARRGQTENVGEKRGARLGVARLHDGVIELNRHARAWIGS